MRSVKVIYANGDSLVTDINGTKSEIEKYYIGRSFNLGRGEHDHITKAVKVIFLDNKRSNPLIKVRVSHCKDSRTGKIGHCVSEGGKLKRTNPLSKSGKAKLDALIAKYGKADGTRKFYAFLNSGVWGEKRHYEKPKAKPAAKKPPRGSFNKYK